MKPFVIGGGRAIALSILHFAATDEALSVQGRAFVYLRSYAFRDFSADYGAYLAWHDRHTGRPLGSVIRDSAIELVARLGRVQGEQLLYELRALDGLALKPWQAIDLDLAAVLRGAGMLSMVDGWVHGGQTGPKASRVNLAVETRRTGGLVAVRAVALAGGRPRGQRRSVLGRLPSVVERRQCLGGGIPCSSLSEALPRGTARHSSAP